MNAVRTLLFATSFWVCECITSSADEARTIKVFDNDGQPVVADVYTLNGDERERIGRTEIDGHITAAIVCKQGQRILVNPQDDAKYYQNKRTECPLKEETKVVVLKKATVAKWVQEAERAETKGEYGAATKLYFEVAEETKAFDEVRGFSFQMKAIENAGQTLNVKRTFDINKSPASYKVSAEFTKGLKSFQKANGLNASGDLDIKTVTAIAAMKG